MITVYLPAMLRHGAADSIEVTDPVRSVDELIAVLDRRLPDFRRKLDDGLLNLAVNDEMLLVRLRQRPLQDGDRVEVVPTISGG